MFGSMVFLIFVSLIFIVLPRPIYASCFLDRGLRQYSATYTLTDSGSAQCKPPNNKPNGTYTIWCDTATEAHAADSVRQPLCGSSEERGKANSTCWNCGGTVKCDGLDFALGATDPFISQIRNPVSPGDTNTDQVWRIPNASIPNNFTYNGMPYSKPSGDLIVCRSNNLACGSSEECTNIIYPEINNRGGGSEQRECTTVTRDIPAVQDADIKLSVRGWIDSPEPRTLLDNIGGDNDRGRGPQLNTIMEDSTPNITGVFQVNYPDGTPIVKDERSNWGVTLMELGTGSDILAPKIGYDIGGGFNYTVLYADNNELTLKATLEDSAAYGYTLHFVDLNVKQEIVDAYVANEKDRENSLVAMPCGFKIGTAKDSKFKVAVADTGTFMDPRVRKDWWNEPSNTSCAGIGLGFVTPQSTQICTVKAAPQATGVGKTAGAVDFCKGCTDKEGFVFTLLQKQIIELEGEVFPSQSTLQVPDLSFYAQWLRRASPYLNPLQIQKKEKPITSSYTVSSTANVSTESDEPKDTCYQQKQGVVTTKFPFLNTLLEHALKLDAFLGPFGKQNNFNFDPRYPNVTLTDRATRGCPEQTSGIAVAASIQNSILKNVFSDIPEFAKPVLLAAVRIASTWGLISGGGKCKTGDPGCSTGGGYSAYVYTHSLTPYGDREIPDHIGVTRENKSKGFVRTFIPLAGRKTFAAAVIDNEFDHPGLFNPVPVNIPFPFAGIGGALQNLDDLRCTLTPRSLQTPDMNCGRVIDTSYTAASITDSVYRAALDNTTPADVASGDCRQANDACAPNMSRAAFPNLSCSYSGGSINGSIALRNSIVKVANHFGVPPAVIAGVLWVENRGSVFNYDNQTVEARQAPGAIDQNTCRPNTCGAVGPMQMSAKPGFDAGTCEAGDRAKDNYQVWCGYRTGANDVRGDTTYQPNPSNILDALAAAAKKMKSNSETNSCGKWSQETVHRVITRYFGTPACTRPYPSLYTLFKNTIKGPADTYAKTQTNALTYCEFVWGYYSTH